MLAVEVQNNTVPSLLKAFIRSSGKHIPTICHVPGTVQWTLRDDGLIGPTDTEYTITNEITIPKVGVRDARGAQSKGSKSSQQKAFLTKWHLNWDLKGAEVLAGWDRRGQVKAAGKASARKDPGAEESSAENKQSSMWSGWRAWGRTEKILPQWQAFGTSKGPLGGFKPGRNMT